MVTTSMIRAYLTSHQTHRLYIFDENRSKDLRNTIANESNGLIVLVYNKQKKPGGSDGALILSKRYNFTHTSALSDFVYELRYTIKQQQDATSSDSNNNNNNDTNQNVNNNNNNTNQNGNKGRYNKQLLLCMFGLGKWYNVLNNDEFMRLFAHFSSYDLKEHLDYSTQQFISIYDLEFSCGVTKKLPIRKHICNNSEVSVEVLYVEYPAYDESKDTESETELVRKPCSPSHSIDQMQLMKPQPHFTFKRKFNCVAQSGAMFMPSDAVWDERVQKWYVSDFSNSCIQVIDDNGCWHQSIASDSSDDSLRLLQWPSSMTLSPNGNLIVCDAYNHRISIWNLAFLTCIKMIGHVVTNGNSTRCISGTEDGHFSCPIGVATDSMNNIYVTDSGNHRVQVFSSVGTFIKSFGSKGSNPGQLQCPRGIAVAPDGNRIYICDSENHRVVVYNNSGQCILVVGSKGFSYSEFKYPIGITLTPENDYFIVSDYKNNRLQVFRAVDGKHIQTIGRGGSGDEEFNNPAGLSMMPSGELVVIDCHNQRFQILENNSQL